MSNHVHNKFSLSGPTDIVQDFKDLAFRIDRASNEEIINFDLNSIVPMPGDLGIVSCATGNHALRLLNSPPETLLKDLISTSQVYFGAIQDAFAFSDQIWNVITVGELLTAIDHMRAYSRCLDWDFLDLPLAKKYKRNIEKYGYPTWYEWRDDNWGCTQNTWRFNLVTDEIVENVHRLSFEFKTNWSAPVPVFYRLSEMYPQLDFKVSYLEEYLQFTGLFVSNVGSCERLYLHHNEPGMNEHLLEYWGIDLEAELNAMMGD